ncbi:MAG: ubiquinone biosynthesis protein UbiB [Pseudomonadales bacterium]|nr:ubiquinone biosynthesis protein UbiB [Pseudomonadales bacterium]
MDFTTKLKSLGRGLKATRDIKRANDIASIMIKYGYADFTQRLGIGPTSLLPFPKPQIDENLSAPDRAIAALQEMGPTFVKLGQLLSTRVDLFSKEWIEAFEKLQTNVSPLPFSAIEPILKQSLPAPILEIFDSIETSPLAAGSIAQVHRAVYQGKDVVLKVQRPNIRQSIESDLRIMLFLAEAAESGIPSLQRFTPKQVVRRFATSMRRELDFTREARASDRIRGNFHNTDYVVIPEIYWDYTSPLVSVQEYIKGIPANDLKGIDAAGLDRKILAVRGVDAFLKMALEDGFFHADPHPGNFFYLADNKLALIDFGLVGSLSDQRRKELSKLLQGAVSMNSRPIVDVLIEWAGDADIDMEGLTSDIDALLEEYDGVNLAQIEIGIVLHQLTTLARNHALTMPPDLTLLIKSVMILEGLGKNLNPDFDLIKEAEPFIRRAVLHRYSPESVFRKSLGSLTELGGLIGDLPRDLRRMLILMRRGYIPININVDQLEEFSHRVESTANRVVIGLIVAALIVGSSIVMTVDAGPMLFGLPFFGMMGFITANLGSAWLLLSMWHNRK